MKLHLILNCFVQADGLGCSSFGIMSFSVVWCKEIPTNKNEERGKDGVEGVEEEK